MTNSAEQIDPPFLERRHAIVFIAAVLLFLSLPWLLVKSGLTSRSSVYATMPAEWAPADHLQREIFEDKSDIDILMVGSSLVYHAIDVHYLQDQLTTKLGRRAKIVLLPYNYRDELLQYYLVRDILAHRKAKMLLLTMPFEGESDRVPHSRTHFWMLAGDDAVNGLPWFRRAGLYASAVLGSPRKLMSGIRADRLESSELSRNLGTRKARETTLPGRKFVEWQPRPLNIEPDQAIYSAQTRDHFRFGGSALSAHQEYFLRLLMDTARKHGLTIATLNIPTYHGMRKQDRVHERRDWSSYFGTVINMIGIPPATLFQNLTDEELDRLYRDNVHFNVNGNEFFTRTMAPAILEVYLRAARS